MSTEIQKTENATLQAYDVTQALPNLHQQAQAVPIDFTSEYWTPSEKGDTKLGFFQEIKNSTYTDEQTGETIELPCVIFLEQKENGELKTIRNGSKRLVATLEDALRDQKIKAGSPLRIEYLGKQKNATNSFQSDRWSVKPLLVQ